MLTQRTHAVHSKLTETRPLRNMDLHPLHHINFRERDNVSESLGTVKKTHCGPVESP
jgi:hypothetical protein